MVLLASGVNALFSGLGINAWAFFSQLVSFGIVFYALWRWALPAVIKTIDKRNATIQEGITNAEQAKRDLADANARAEQILIEARRQAQQTIDRAAKVAQDEAHRIEEDSRARLEQMSQQQKANIQQEANRARNDLSRLVVNLSIDAAGRVVERSVDNNDNRRFVEEFVTSSNQARER